MEEHGYEVVWLPKDLYFEGEGDALFGGDVLFCGYKFRSDINSHRAVADMLGCLVISVELVDPRFYHIDTCFCPLPDGGAFWFPEAFDEYGQRTIRDHLPDLIDVAPRRRPPIFPATPSSSGATLFCRKARRNWSATLKDRGYTCHPLPMSEFLKAGGACKCLTMFMPQRDVEALVPSA